MIRADSLPIPTRTNSSTLPIVPNPSINLTNPKTLVQIKRTPGGPLTHFPGRGRGAPGRSLYLNQNIPIAPNSPPSVTHALPTVNGTDFMLVYRNISNRESLK